MSWRTWMGFFRCGSKKHKTNQVVPLSIDVPMSMWSESSFPVPRSPTASGLSITAIMPISPDLAQRMVDNQNPNWTIVRQISSSDFSSAGILGSPADSTTTTSETNFSSTTASSNSSQVNSPNVQQNSLPGTVSNISVNGSAVTQATRRTSRRNGI